MKYVLGVPSLQDVMLVQNAVILWKKYRIDWNFSKAVTEMWPVIENEVCRQAKDLMICHFLKPMLCTFVKLIGRQLRDWINLLMNFHLIDDRKILDYLIGPTQWTIHGKLDVRKSAIALSQLENLTIEKKFEISRVFCLADQIADHWSKYFDIMDENFQEIESSEERNLKNLLLNFWKDNSYKIDPTRITSDKKFDLFLKSMKYGHQSAVEYFWSLMNDDERNELLRDQLQTGSKLDLLITSIIIDHEKNDGDCCGFRTSIIFFILSQLNKRQIDDTLFSIVGSELYIPLLYDFVYVEFVVPTINHVLNRMSNGEFNNIFVLLAQTSSLCDCLHRFKLKLCITDLWTNANSVMRSFIHRCTVELTYCCVFPALCTARDLTNIELLLSDVSVINRRRVLSRCVTILGLEIYDMDWDFLAFVVKRLITTSEEMAIFKRYCCFVAFKVCTALNVGEESQWAVIDRFLNFSFMDKDKIKKFKKYLAFNCVMTGGTVNRLAFVNRFLSWCQITSFEVKRQLLPRDNALFYCFDQDMQKNALIFANKSVNIRRRILSRSFFEIVQREDCMIDWDFVEDVARTFITTGEELMIFKENCSCVAYKVCTDIFHVDIDEERQMIDKFLNFCFGNDAEEIIQFKKSLAYVFFSSRAIDAGFFTADDPAVVIEILTWCCLTHDEIDDFSATYII